VVLAAALASGAKAVLELGAALFCASPSLLSAGVHSVADLANRGMLLFGLGLARDREWDRHPIGRANESHFWAFLGALGLFFAGGMFSLYAGIDELSGAERASGSRLLSTAVLLSAVVVEAASFRVTLRQFAHTRGDRSIRDAIFGGKDPVIPMVLLQNTGAMLGLVVALIAVVTSWATGSSIADGIGSIVIGVLLFAIGLSLAHDTRGILIGESASSAVRKRVLQIARGTPGVEDVAQLHTLHLDPESIVLALKIRLAPGTSPEEAERISGELRTRVSDELPAMKHVVVEPEPDSPPLSRRA
jgi:cation diffusion facilitator family transporter